MDAGYGRAAVAVSLFAVGNGLGRILAGSLSEVIHQSRLAPRPLNLFFATGIMGLAHLLFWLELGIAGLYIAVFLAAFAFGAVSFCLRFCQQSVVFALHSKSIRHFGLWSQMVML